MRVLREILRFHHRLYEDRQRLVGGPYRAAVIRLLILAWIDSKPLDASAIASACHLTRQRVMRMVAVMVREGLVTTHKRKDRTVIQPTQEMLDRFIPLANEVVERYERLFERLQRLKNRGVKSPLLK